MICDVKWYIKHHVRIWHYDDDTYVIHEVALNYTSQSTLNDNLSNFQLQCIASDNDKRHYNDESVVGVIEPSWEDFCVQRQTTRTVESHKLLFLLRLNEIYILDILFAPTNRTEPRWDLNNLRKHRDDSF